MSLDQPAFAGADYQPERDDTRLKGQLHRVFSVMASGRWYTLPGIASVTGDPEASISAQLRHLRKPQYGGHTIERRYIKNGLCEYRMVFS